MGHKLEDWIILKRLGEIVLQHVPGSVIEIGIGVSTQILSCLAKKFDARYFGCDINQKRCDWASQQFGTDFYCCKSIKFLNLISDQILPGLKDTPSLILLDGDHKYPTVRAEVDFLLPRLNIGGLMFLHDTYKKSWDDIYLKTGTSDSYLVRQELDTDPTLQVITFPYTAANMGLTIVMKKDMNAPIFRK